MAEFLRPEHGRIRIRVLRHDALDVCMHSTIHRPVKCLVGLDATIEEPSPRRLLFGVAVGRLTIPRDVPPENWFMKRCRFPDRARIHTVVEEHNDRTSPVPTDRERATPASRALHVMCREVERADLRLRQVVPPRYVALRLVLRESRQGIDDILLAMCYASC